MKKAACILLSLLLLLSLAACGTPADPTEAPETPNVQTPSEPSVPAGIPTDPVEPTDDPTEPEEPAKPDESAMYSLAADPSNDLNLTIYVGRYYKEDPGEADAHYLEVQAHGDFLTLEHSLYMEDGLYAFWVEEFWPNSDEIFTDLYDQRHGLCQTFSTMTTIETYDDTPSICTVTYTDAGIAISRGGEYEYYIMDDIPSLSTPTEELQAQLQAMEGGAPAGALVGHWHGWSAQVFTYAELNDDGSFFWLRKASGRPVEIYRGAWTVNADNTLVIFAERLGAGTMPYLTYVQWTYEAEEAGLTLQEEDAVLLPDAQGFCYLGKCEGDVYIPFFQEVALDYSFEGWEPVG